MAQVEGPPQVTLRELVEHLERLAAEHGDDCVVIGQFERVEFAAWRGRLAIGAPDSALFPAGMGNNAIGADRRPD